MKPINSIPVHITIEGSTFEFEANGWYHPQDEHQAEEFAIDHLYYLKKGEQYSKDFSSLLDWPHVHAEVINQLKAVIKDEL